MSDQENRATRRSPCDHNNSIELTILMPCLDEEKTVGLCIEEAFAYLEKAGCSGEVLIVDNGSRDRSAEVAAEKGARVVMCSEKGYGNALRFGICYAKGRFIIMGDCDLSYDFFDLEMMHGALLDGCDLVVGDRFAVPPVREAMPFSHRWGVPLLSWMGRRRYHCDVKDFHCGLRGFRRDAVMALKLAAPGMEFATEIIGKATAAGLRIGQVPVVLRPDGRDGKPHLRTFRDGVRHVRLMLLDK